MGKITLNLIGVSCFIGFIAFVLGVGGHVLGFFHVPSALFVLGTAGGLGLAGYREGGWIGFLRSFKRHLIIAGVLGTIIGIIQMMQNISSPDEIGGGVAVALLTTLYSLILYGLTNAMVETAPKC